LREIAPAAASSIVATVMSRAFLLIIVILGWAGSSRANDAAMRVSPPAVREEVAAVIEAQLAAFRASDVEKAYGCASQAFRAQVSLAAFARMVERNYPEIWRNTRADLGIVRGDDARVAVPVHIFTKTSDAIYDYVLYRDKAGWRIGGVLRRDPKKGNGV
jgi:hypothetical protein